MAWITFIGTEHFPSQIGTLESEARAWAKLTGVKQLCVCGGGYREMRGQVYTLADLSSHLEVMIWVSELPTGNACFSWAPSYPPPPCLSPSQTHSYPRPNQLVQLLTGNPQPHLRPTLALPGALP